MAIGRSAAVGLVPPLVPLAAMWCACTLTHPLDEYHAGEPAADASSESAAFDAGDAAPSEPVDAGDGCTGNPQILMPMNGDTVGATFHLTVSAPTCLSTLIFYVDSMLTLKIMSSAIDQEVPIAIGKHHINVNGFAGTAQAHLSASIEITRTK